MSRRARSREEAEQARWIGLQPMPEDAGQEEPEPVECQHCGSDLTGWEGALRQWAHAHRDDADLLALCPNGRGLTCGDLAYILAAGLGGPANRACADLLARAGIRWATIPQYRVTADPETGMWLGEPEHVGEVEQDVWALKRDTDAVHHDTYEVDGQTRAIAVEWVGT